MSYTIGLVNRRVFPTKYVVVVEDDLEHQTLWLRKLSNLYDNQGDTTITMAATTIEAVGAIVERTRQTGGLPSYVILDHDLQLGNGQEFIRRFSELGYTFPLMLSSGLDHNNERMETVAREVKWVHPVVTLRYKHTDPRLESLVREFDTYR